MSNLTVWVLVWILLAAIGFGVGWLSPRLFPKFKPGQRVVFDGDITGIYVRRSSWGGHHQVKVTGPSWYSAARDGRIITVHASKERLRPA